MDFNTREEQFFADYSSAADARFSETDPAENDCPPLKKRKRVHWSAELVEIFYFVPNKDLLPSFAEIRQRRMSKSRSHRSRASTLTRSAEQISTIMVMKGLQLISTKLNDLTVGNVAEDSNPRWDELLQIYIIKERLKDEKSDWVWTFSVCRAFGRIISFTHKGLTKELAGRGRIWRHTVCSLSINTACGHAWHSPGWVRVLNQGVPERPRLIIRRIFGAFVERLPCNKDWCSVDPRTR